MSAPNRHRIPGDVRSAVHSEGVIGGPCHAVTREGTFCKFRAVVIGRDGYGYCRRHEDDAR